MELRCLGMKDLIVVNGGSNDLANNSGKGKSALLHLLKFVQKYANTNVLMVNTPTRYDPLTNYQSNHEIKNFNEKLQKRTKVLNHDHLVQTTTDRKCFTKHGFHQNKLGNDGLAKEIACQINKIITSGSDNKPAYPVHWKEERIAKNTIMNIVPPLNCTRHEGNVPETETKSPQGHSSQQKLTKLDCLQRTSNRQNKATIQRNNEFLW